MTEKKLGCLILHGLTSSLDCVNGLVPYMKRNGIPYRMPILRGHGTKPEDLIGVTWRDWYADGEAALLDLCKEVDRAVVVGLSMGGLVGLQLAMEHADQVDSFVGVAAALRLANPLAPGKALSFLRPVIARLVKFWPLPPDYCLPALAQFNTNYTQCPMTAVASFLEFGGEVEKRLPEVKVPLLIIQSHADAMVDPTAAQVIHDRSSSTEKRILWFEKSKHEMMRDVEREEVFKAIEGFVLERRKKA